MRGLARGFGAALLVAIALPFQPMAGGHPAAAPARVFDRTFVCSTAIVAGIRKIDLYAGPGVREGSRNWRTLAYAGASTGVFGAPDGQLGGISAGGPRPANYDWTVHIYRGRCTPTVASVPLSARGLTGGAVRFREDYECFPPSRILVRYRAVFRSPTALRLYRPRNALFAREPVKEAFLAVRAPSGRPLALAVAHESGKARLFTAPSCIEDNT
jgi:hypothetical protein